MERERPPPVASTHTERALRWTWTDTGFRVELPQIRPIPSVASVIGPNARAVAWGAVVAALVVGSALLGYGLSYPERATELVLLIGNLAIAAFALVMRSLSFGPAEPAVRSPVVLEVRGDTLFVDSEAWPLEGLRTFEFRIDEDGLRLDLGTDFRSWSSGLVPESCSPTDQMVLVEWLREARAHASVKADERRDLRERARAATSQLRETGPRR